MASEQGEARQILIGAAIGPSIGSVFNTIENRLKHLEQRGSEVKLLRGSIEEARRLETELEKVEDKGSRTAIRLQGSLDQVREKLKQQKVDVTRLGEAYKTLGRVAEGIEQQKAGMQLISEGKASIAQARTTFNGLMGPVKAAAGFDDKIVDIIAKAGEGSNAETLKESISRTASSISKDTRMSSSDVVNLIGTMQGEGMSLGDSVGQASVAAKFSASQGVDAKDTAKLVSSLSDAGISSADMEKVLSRLAAQAKGSDVDISGVAQAMAKLLPSLGEGKSADDILRLGAMIQVKVGGAESADDGIKELKTSLKEGKVATPEAAKAAMGDGKQADYDKLLKKGANGASSKDADKTILDDDLKLRQTSGQNLKDASNAVEDLKRDFGAILLPSVGSAANAFAEATRSANELMNSHKSLVFGVTATVAALSALGAIAGGVKIAKGAVDVGIGLFKQGSGAASAGKPGSFVQRVGQMLTGGGGSPPDGGASAASSGLPGNAGGPVDVFVVNLGGLAGGPVGTGGNPQRPVSSEPSPVEPAQGQKADSSRRARSQKRSKAQRLLAYAKAKTTRYLRPTSLMRRSPIGRVFSAGSRLLNVFTGNGSKGEKILEVGKIASGLGGAAVGAAAGAAIGSVIPVVGTAIGGLVGGMIGGDGVEAIVGWIGKKMLGSGKKRASAPASKKDGKKSSEPVVGSAVDRQSTQSGTVDRSAASGKAHTIPGSDGSSTALLAAGVFSSVAAQRPQPSITFAPNVPITIQGIISDPAEIVRKLETELQRLFNRLMQQTKSGELIDPAMP